MQEYKGAIPNNQKENYREKLSNHIIYELKDSEYCSRSKVGEGGVFSRNRVLTMSSLIFLIMKFKSSIQRELDRFIKEVS